MAGGQRCPRSPHLIRSVRGRSETRVVASAEQPEDEQTDEESEQHADDPGDGGPDGGRVDPGDPVIGQRSADGVTVLPYR